MSEGSLSLDRALLGTARSIPVTVASLDGAVVDVRPLRPTEITEAVGPGSDARSSLGESTRAATKHRVLAIACSLRGGPAFDDADDAAGMPVDVIALLWSAYLRVHASVYEIDSSIGDEMDERLKASGTWIERLRARNAAGIVAFYGLERASDATATQVVWFAELMKKESR